MYEYNLLYYALRTTQRKFSYFFLYQRKNINIGVRVRTVRIFYSTLFYMIVSQYILFNFYIFFTFFPSILNVAFCAELKFFSIVLFYF